MSTSPRFVVRVKTVQLAKAIGSKFFGFDDDRFFCICSAVPTSITDYHVLSSHEVLALRLEFEMRAFGVLCGPDVRGRDVAEYLFNQSERYFGFPSSDSEKFPHSFFAALALSVTRASLRGYIFADSSGGYPHCIHRLFEPNDILFEEIAKIMYLHWFDLMDICSVPFQYPELKGCSPNLVLPSFAGPIRGELFYFTYIFASINVLVLFLFAFGASQFNYDMLSNNFFLSLAFFSKN